MHKYRGTLIASHMGCVIQALVINFAPLLYVTFEKSYGLTLSQISVLIVINFSTQLLMDISSSKYVDILGYRTCILFAHLSAFLGIAGFSFLPDIMPSFWGLALCMVLCGVGGGIIEVVISPVVEALPTGSKSASMSILHSFYSWGHAMTVLGSTLFFVKAGIENWKILALIWSLVPLVNGILFAFVPIEPLNKEDEEVKTIGELLKNKIFWVFLCAMICGGAAELTIAQWASAFAENALKISKAKGDILGACMFALLMGTGRLLYALFKSKIRLIRFMRISAVVLLISYILIIFSPNAAISLAGCALSGLSVGIMWPGIISLSTRKFKNGGTAMFALLAFTGDIGCVSGPSVVGFVSDMAGGNIKTGFMAALVFPVVLAVSLVFADAKKPVGKIEG